MMRKRKFTVSSLPWRTAELTWAFLGHSCFTSGINSPEPCWDGEDLERKARVMGGGSGVLILRAWAD